MGSGVWQAKNKRDKSRKVPCRFMGRFMGRFIVGLRYKIEIYGLIFGVKNPKYGRATLNALAL